MIEPEDLMTHDVIDVVLDHELQQKDDVDHASGLKEPLVVPARVSPASTPQMRLCSRMKMVLMAAYPIDEFPRSRPSVELLAPVGGKPASTLSSPT